METSNVEVGVSFTFQFLPHPLVIGMVKRTKGSHPGPFFLFFYKAYKRGGGSFPFIKIYVVDFIYSGGLWQHEIGIEKVF